jgi:subtilisin family serine protease
VILDTAAAARLDVTRLPQAFGHGTMVAGLVHMVAPAAAIMPLKAFRADGTSNLFDIERAIYYAADHGAKVINMSFSMDTASAEITHAIDYASSHGVICLASAGNSARSAVVFPAGFRNVIGIASTSATDERSSFSNYGDHLVKIAAPGEMLTTLYPGGRYANVSGTSFSTALVTGGVGLLAQWISVRLVVNWMTAPSSGLTWNWETDALICTQRCGPAPRRRRWRIRARRRSRR